MCCTGSTFIVNRKYKFIRDQALPDKVKDKDGRYSAWSIPHLYKDNIVKCVGFQELFIYLTIGWKWRMCVLFEVTTRDGIKIVAIDEKYAAKAFILVE